MAFDDREGAKEQDIGKARPATLFVNVQIADLSEVLGIGKRNPCTLLKSSLIRSITLDRIGSYEFVVEEEEGKVVRFCDTARQTFSLNLWVLQNQRLERLALLDSERARWAYRQSYGHFRLSYQDQDVGERLSLPMTITH
ncbi:hypothetical protein NDO48_07270 [Aminobacter sp. MET-1]|nr:hypothetical protein [Aminobacter sp. MET-1]MCX8568802.1 hypothetical protein [Aminobacter sp. MET-1]